MSNKSEKDVAWNRHDESGVVISIWNKVNLPIINIRNKEKHFINLKGLIH